MRGNSLPFTCFESLATQVRWLTPRLEYHLLGNHLLTNAKALIYAGLYFNGNESERWLSKGLGILHRELSEQLLRDGGHFELSPMYHAAVLEDLLDLINLLRAYGRQPPSVWLDAVARMHAWLTVMTHPDGEIAFFNDAAFGEAPNLSQLKAYAGRLGLPLACGRLAFGLIALKDSGYVRAQLGPACLICDCAPVGPEYLPGHAHADTLSFELSLFGRRILVNSGTSQYGADAERQRQRGTAAHNTVVVNGQDSSEVWAGFRVARRAHARVHEADATDECCIVEASHDGYQRLSGKNEHRRRWQLDAESLLIQDRVSGAYKGAKAYFHLYPEVEARTTDGQGVVLACPTGQVVQIAFEGADAFELQTGTWHPRFGSALSNSHIVAHFAGPTLVTRLSWRQPA
jgi:uncharacterized heparinase superfamily protein